MSSLMKGLSAAALTGMLAFSGTAVPTQAQELTYSQRDRVVLTYCQRHPRDRDCRGFHDRRWSDDDYDRFYRSRRSNLDAIASGIFGFTFGAIVGGAIANSQRDDDLPVIYLDDDDRYSSAYEAHVAACYDRYRSYDEESDTFLGYDGYRHRCRL